jgi:hypothetical protein
VPTIRSVRSWYDGYRADGLALIGVHSPELDLAKDHGNVPPTSTATSTGSTTRR